MNWIILLVFIILAIFAVMKLGGASTSQGIDGTSGIQPFEYSGVL